MPKPVVKKGDFPTGNGSLALSVANFDGQQGLSTVLLETKVVVVGGIINVSLGTSSECKGKKLFILSDIRDVLGETDDTTLTVTLKDDSSSKTFFYAATALSNGDAVMYEVTISLI
jgi:hypothetical protein